MQRFLLSPNLYLDEFCRSQMAERFGTIHKFCKQHEAALNRSTVYMVLRGVYAGDTDRQVERIKNALNDQRPEE
jgi:hypothetical protein